MQVAQARTDLHSEAARLQQLQPQLEQLLLAAQQLEISDQQLLATLVAKLQEKKD